MMRLGSKISIFVYVLVSSWSLPGWAADIPWKIDEPAAQQLAAEANGEAYRPDQFRKSDDRKSAPFFVVDLYAWHADIGVIDSFAINPWTGDVWDLLGCYKLLNYELRQSQLKVRKQFTHEELKHYDELAAIRPKCLYSDW